MHVVLDYWWIHHDDLDERSWELGDGKKTHELIVIPIQE
jgi:hypothetical protein